MVTVFGLCPNALPARTPATASANAPTAIFFFLRFIVASFGLSSHFGRTARSPRSPARKVDFASIVEMVRLSGSEASTRLEPSANSPSGLPPVSSSPNEGARLRTVDHDEARRIGERIGIDWTSSPFDVEQFRAGMEVELEHGAHDPETDVTHDDPIVTGKIAWAHLKEFADYYTRLE